MRRIAAALVIATLVLVAAAGLATASPAGQESCLAGERPGGGTGRYRTFTEGYLKGLPLSGGYFSCLKSQPPYTFFWQDWYGVELSGLLDSEVGLAVGSTGLKVISSDGYYVELTLDQARMTNSQGLNTILAWQRGVVNAPHQEPPLEVIDGGEGPFRLVVPQHPDVGDYASGGDPNWQLSAKWVSAIEVQPLPAGVTPVDPATIPAGNIVVYGNLKTLSIDGIEPTWGPPGTVVTLSGYGFGVARGSSTVSFGGINATGYEAWADSSIRCTVPPGVSGRVEVVVTTPQEVSEPFVFTVSDTPPPPPAAFYFAEGTCRPGFDPYLCIQNPGAKDAGVKITYMKGDGSTDTQELTVGKNSRSTVVVKERLGEADDSAHDFSCKVETTNQTEIIVERPMYFNYRGVWTGGHDVVGATSPEETFYFAEGTCRPGFDPYLCIQNPGAKDAGVKITYMKGDGSTDTQELTVGKNSRSTVVVKERLGEADDSAHDFSCKVETTNQTEIIVERPMYFNYRGVWTGGHDVVGETPAW